MLGGRFDEHPWGVADGTVVVDDPQFPAMRHLPARSVFHDELYQIKDFSREKIRVLAHLDSSQLDLRRALVHRTDGDFPAAWAKAYARVECSTRSSDTMRTTGTTHGFVRCTSRRCGGRSGSSAAMRLPVVERGAEEAGCPPRRQSDLILANDTMGMSP